MRTLSRALARWEAPRVAGATVAVAFALALAGFVGASFTASPELSGVLAAVSAAAIAAAGILYAWREPGA